MSSSTPGQRQRRRRAGEHPDARVQRTRRAGHSHHAGPLRPRRRTCGSQEGVRGEGAGGGGDAPIVEGGGKGDYLFGPEYYFPPTKVDAHRPRPRGGARRRHRAHRAPHAGPHQGRHHLDHGRHGLDRARPARRVPREHDRQPGHEAGEQPDYPTIAEDYLHAFEIEKALTCEVFLAAHGSAFNGPAKAAAAAGGQGDAAFIDPQGCRAAIDRSEKAFLAELAKQRAGQR